MRIAEWRSGYTVYYVDSDKELRCALRACRDGDIIEVAPGTVLNPTKPYIVGCKATIDGNGATVAPFGFSTSNIFVGSDGAVVKNLRFTGCDNTASDDALDYAAADKFLMRVGKTNALVQLLARMFRNEKERYVRRENEAAGG